MNTPLAPAPEAEEYKSVGPLPGILLAATVGAAVALLLLPFIAPALAQSLLGANPKAFWYLSRSTALVALVLLWLSNISGLLITGKVARTWPGSQTAFSLHEYVSILGLAFALFHAIILLGDSYIQYTLVQILLPFSGGAYRPEWVKIGQLALYVWAIVTVSFYVRKLISQRVWKILHYFSFFTFAASIIHGIASGTDTSLPFVQGLYWVLGGSMLFFTVYRIIETTTSTTAADAAR